MQQDFASIPDELWRRIEASHLDVMKVAGLVDDEQYVRGIELLERVVAMLTKLIDPCPSSITSTGAFPCTCTATITITGPATATITITITITGFDGPF